MAGFFSCHAKQGFETWHAAAAVAKSMRRRHNVPTQCYSCRFCHRFHVGTAVRFAPVRLALRPRPLTPADTVRLVFEGSHVGR